MNQLIRQLFERYIAIDAHKHYVVVGGLNAQMEIVLPLRKIAISRFADWAETNLEASDAVVIEATTNTWALYDVINPLAGKTVVAHPPKVRMITGSRVKTDKTAVWSLAQLLIAGLIPEVWVPPIPVRELRALVTHRRRLVQTRGRTQNRLHSVTHRLNLTPPQGKVFAPKHRQWWLDLDLSSSERLRLLQDLDTLDHLQVQVEATEEELERLSLCEPWAPFVPYLLQLPGFGLIVAMTILAAIGDISRFPSAKKLVGYAGLGASIHDSGKTLRRGRITKEGRKELRWALVQAAWCAVRTHPYWKQRFERLSRRMHANKAIVAIARKLLVVVWHVLTECAADRNADVDMVAFKLMTWSWDLGKERRNGLTTPQFVRHHLMRLKMGEDLTHVLRGGQVRPIAPVEEVLALKSGP
jgi:transposase